MWPCSKKILFTKMGGGLDLSICCDKAPTPGTEKTKLSMNMRAHYTILCIPEVSHSSIKISIISTIRCGNWRKENFNKPIFNFGSLHLTSSPSKHRVSTTDDKLGEPLQGKQGRKRKTWHSTGNWSNRSMYIQSVEPDSEVGFVWHTPDSWT